ncbi:hypothetical protein QR680_001806 [Steinernema hermaphroditum]|uniref:MULE transposase domain-containing protein n=1 Tax=Steinernema hermaphroditum TaxID=289476 RepID=A0AA39H029_9BILA|nr:hypothetical protein QR680_001806 [Steinernema hermaphroditum]
MANKTEDSYAKVFEKIADRMNGRQPRSFMSDYELAARNAVQARFPDVQLKGCLFHLGQSVYRYVSKKGYVSFYNQVDSEFRKLIRSLIALSLLPLNTVEEGFQELTSRISDLPPAERDAAFAVFAYFETTYVSRFNRQGPMPPRFPMDTWNSHEAVVNDLPRTNNALEGFHHAFKSNFANSKPNLSKVLVALQEEEVRAQARLRPHLLDPSQEILAFRRKKTYSDNDRHIKALVDLFDLLQPHERDFIHHLFALQYRLGSF